MTDNLPQLVQRLVENLAGQQAMPDDSWRPQLATILTALDTLTRALAEAQETAHYANGVSELAMKHRDAAESALAAMTQERDEAIHQRDVVIVDLQSVQRHDRAAIDAAVREARAETEQSAT